ncbi:replication initiator [Streptosporangium sp. NPDC023963]|uniref:replication initiator n=1 Tax=Streptosporangium sp. NPDC023963 TaxID=3155608 RepID=UPI00343FB875
MAVTLDGERDILGLWAGDGGEGVPEEVSGHPRMFATFTVPSFGVVHAHRSGENGKPLPCRPRRDRPVREHRRPESRGARHDSDAPQVGQPLCVDCYDYRDTGLR